MVCLGASRSGKPSLDLRGISVIAKDQIEDYAQRKGMTVDEAEKWLGPWLGY